MLYLINALSLNMFEIDDTIKINTIKIKVIPLLPEQAKTLIKLDKDILVSAIGHEDTARIISNLLGLEIKPNRINVKLTLKDYAIVAQYVGPRLDEGATELPKGAEVKFYMVTIWP